MNLPCGYVEGDVEMSPGVWSGHAWNVVKIDGQWLHVDSTWASGYGAGKEFVKSFQDKYFLVPPKGDKTNNLYGPVSTRYSRLTA